MFRKTLGAIFLEQLFNEEYKGINPKTSYYLNDCTNYDLNSNEQNKKKQKPKLKILFVTVPVPVTSVEMNTTV